MKKKIYISIPISGHDPVRTREKADRIKAALSRRGWDPVNPFEIYAGNNPTYEDLICSDLQALMGCDAVYFCEGWAYSCGCGIEHDVVMRLKAYGRRDIQVIYEK